MNSCMAHAYSHLYGLPTTGLRYFTVYGPWGRPDMAMFLFTDKILQNEPIQVFNYGKMKRDFTYIDDIIAITTLLNICGEYYNKVTTCGITSIYTYILTHKLFKKIVIQEKNYTRIINFIREQEIVIFACLLIVC